MLKKILVPTDFSACADAALERAALLALECNAELILLHVRDELLFVAPDGFSYLPAQAYKEHERQIEEQLAEQAKRLGARGVRVSARNVFGRPQPEILRVADAEQVDLIVMGTHGRRALGRLFLGSVAEHLTRRARVPVMTVHASPQPAQQRAAG